LGEWALVTTVARGAAGDPLALGDVTELWAIPLGGGEPKLAARYANPAAVGTSDTNAISRGLSPDGRRIVISAATPRASAAHGRVSSRSSWRPDG